MFQQSKVSGKHSTIESPFRHCPHHLSAILGTTRPDRPPCNIKLFVYCKCRHAFTPIIFSNLKLISRRIIKNNNTFQAFVIYIQGHHKENATIKLIYSKSYFYIWLLQLNKNLSFVTMIVKYRLGTFKYFCLDFFFWPLINARYL